MKCPMETRIVRLIDNQNGEAYLFGTDKNYVVPEYQREYSWGEKEIQCFMESIKRAANGEDVFMGTVQFDYDESHRHEYNIIDGQQRMTTFLLLCHLLEQGLLQKHNINLEIRNFGSNNAKLCDALTSDTISADNRYAENKELLNGCIEEIIKEGEKYTKEKIKNAILNNVYFVELVTKNIPLPEVVGIFNTINTTGLDLDCSDIFKLQYFEYLKKNNPNENWMHKICELYETVNQTQYCKMFDILDIYKHCIVAKNGWNFDMLSKGNETFFDEVFTKSKDADIEILQFKEFEKIVRLYIDFYENKLRSNDIALINMLDNPIDIFAVNLIWNTRYSRYWTLPFVAAYFDKSMDNTLIKYKNALRQATEILKYLIVCSVNFDKVINPVQTFICKEILRALCTNSTIGEKIKFVICNSNKREFISRIKSNLFENGKRTYIVCSFSALLDETKKGTSVADIKDKLFNWKDNPYDMEHIYARNIFEKKDPENYAEYNGIGNLVALERKINRGIGDDEPIQKARKYDESNFVSVQKIKEQIETDGKWEIAQVRERCEEQTDLLCDFLGLTD